MTEKKPLRCPDCGDTITANLEWTGRAYLQYQIVGGFECDNYKCNAMWDSKGEPEGSA